MAYQGPNAIIHIGVDGVDESRRQLNNLNESMNEVGNSVSDSVNKVLSGIAVGVVVKEIIRMSDTYDQIIAKLRQSTSSSAQLVSVQKELVAQAERQRVSLESIADLYAKTTGVATEMGASQKDVLKFTEGVAAALRLQGTSSDAASGALTQLGQAIGGTKVQAEEYNSILDGARPLLQAVSNHIAAAGGSVSALTALVKDGKVTSAEFFAAAVLGSDELVKAAGEIPLTFSQALGIAQDRMMLFVGGMNESTGVVTLMSKSIVAASEVVVMLSNHLDVVVSVVGTLIAARLGSWAVAAAGSMYQTVVASRALAAANVATAQTEFAAAVAADRVTQARVIELRAAVLAAEGNVALAITTNGLIPAEANATRTALALTSAHTALAAAQGAASVAAGVLSTAMAVLGGPVGLIITALGIGATAWYMWGKSASDAQKEAAGGMEESSAEIFANLDKQNAKLRERLALAKAGQAELAKTDSPAVQDLAKMLTKINALRAQGIALSGVEQITMYDLEYQYKRNLGKVQEGLDLKKAVEGVTRDSKLQSWYAQNGSNSQKLAAELQKLRDEFGTIPPEMEKIVRAKYPAEGGAELKAGLAASLDAIKASVEQQKTLRTESLATMAEMNRQGLVSEVEYNDARVAAVLAAGIDVAKVKAAEMASVAKLTAKDDAERIANAAKVAGLERERVEALRSSAVAAKLLREQIAFDKDKPLRDAEDASNKEVSAIYDQVAAIELQIRTYGMLPAAITAVAIADLEAQKAALAGFDNSEQATAAIDRKIAALQRLKTAQATSTELDTGSDVARAKDLLDILTAVDNATKQAAAGMADSFGAIGAAIGGLTTAMSGYGQVQATIAAELAAATKNANGDTTKIARANAAAAQQSAQAQIKSYGDMAAAGKGFFKENSAGYKVLQTTEKAFRAYEMAMALESMVKKIFFKETEVAANIGLNTAKVSGEAAASAASTGLAATEASAWGITAVVKALASLPFPLNLAAGAATLAAVVAIGAKLMGGMGGSSVSLSEQRQAANGTGSVLGDSSAKSESIAHSLAIMEKNSGLGLAHTISMDSSLKQMVSGIGNLSSLLARDGVTAAGGGAAAGVQTGTKVLGGTLGTVTGAVAGGVGGAALGTYLGMGMAAIGGPLGLAIGAVLGSVLGGVVSKLFNTSTSIKDQGITGKAMSLGDVDALGFTAQAYADINTKKKALGISYSSKNSTQTAALSDEMNDQFSMIISSMGDTIRSAADVLGLGGAAFNAKLNTFVVDLGKISLKDLKGEEQQKALETAFSKLGDDMAKFGVAGLAQYQAVGEGYLETLVRVTNDYMQVSDVLAVLGKSFNVTGLGAIALSESLITAAGGLDKLTSGTGFFVENFLTEAERMAPITKSVNDAMGKLGVSGVTTVDQFKALVLAQDLSTVAGQAMYAQLIAIAEPFKTAADYAAELAAATGDFAAVAKTASEIASEHRDLQQQLNELTKSENQLLVIQRAGIADVNKALFDQVQAAKAVVSAKDALSKAYDTEKSAMTSSLTALKSWATTVGGLNASLALGNQSILTPEQRYAEARAQFEKTLAAANAGDTSAQSGLSAAEQAFLTASQVVNASDAKYVADYARVMAANDEAMRWASTQVDVQQASLDALTKQVSGLITINDSVLTVAQAITNLQMAMGVSNGLGVEFTNAPAPVPVVFDATRYSAGSNAGSDALVAEIRGLREDNKALQKAVDGLRAEQKDQTGASIRATVESNASAARVVVAGVDKSAKTSAWEKANRKAEYV
ncbi:tape measure protein [Janthinobacterium psychrotolerans]|uniref:Tape measure domain-containing protein n=1 Tax=Janthinobacterium psychrotolerans TaxID=1747903 RepID=A0A1A7BVY6_9BURK|nr:tape measure protein [Janthinobacterium psychrotolerans]OBV37726.1 tape measure domain-containing protein [Janthinobacterium psychrotolerans]